MLTNNIYNQLASIHFFLHHILAFVESTAYNNASQSWLHFRLLKS